MRPAALALLLLVPACAPELDDAPLDRLALPTGLALTPEDRYLLVSNGNWDRTYANSSLIALDLAALDDALLALAPPDASLDRDHPCRRAATDDDEPRIECEARFLIDASLGVRIPSGAGNLVLDRPGGPAGPLRVLVPSRLQPSVSWIDVFGPGYGGEDERLRFACQQDDQQICARTSRVGVVADPARLTRDEQGFRYAYLPHLTGQQLTLLALDGPEGPHVVDVEYEFFREDSQFESGLGGGFTVAQRACSLAEANAPLDSLDCTRPVLVASQRFWPGVREFQVAPGLDVVIPGSEATIAGPNLEAIEPRPLMGGVAFEDPDRGDRLLVLHTTAPALTRVDTSLDEQGELRFDELATLDLCNNPNVLVVHRPSAGPALALIACYGDDELAVVDLGVFVQIAAIEVGEGPNELLVDAARARLYVANTIESSISIVDLAIGSTGYLKELARVR